MRSRSSHILPAMVGAAAFVLVASLSQFGLGSPKAVQAQAGTPTLSAVLHAADGSEVGSVVFTDQAGSVLVDASVSGLPSGYHGFHVHAVGKCDAPDFASAGGHFDPTGMAVAPMHAGDLPSLLVNQDGGGQLQAATDRFSVGNLLDGAGTAVIVHANADNFGNIPTRYVPAPDATTQATGDAGPRIACGVIQSTTQ